MTSQAKEQYAFEVVPLSALEAEQQRREEAERNLERADDLAKGNYSQACRFRDELLEAEAQLQQAEKDRDEARAEVKRAYERGDEDASNRLCAFFDDVEYPEPQLRSRLAFAERRLSQAEQALEAADRLANRVARMRSYWVPGSEKPPSWEKQTYDALDAYHHLRKGEGE